MSNFIGQVYNAQMFTWNKESRTLVSEMSSTPAVLRQLYDDSFDLGFGIESHRTGFVAHFSLVAQFRDVDGDIYKWVFEPTQKSIAKQPYLAGVEVHIFNT